MKRFIVAEGCSDSPAPQTSWTAASTQGTTYSVALSEGLNGGAGTRYMARLDGMATFPYYVYEDEARLNDWGSTDTQVVQRTGTGSLQTLTVYSEILARVEERIGSYSDTLTATVTF